jgi:hypothetical protein
MWARRLDRAADTCGQLHPNYDWGMLQGPALNPGSLQSFAPLPAAAFQAVRRIQGAYRFQGCEPVSFWPPKATTAPRPAREELRRSLDRMGVDHINLWQRHALADPIERDEALSPGGALEAAVEAREQGLIRWIG